MKFVHHFLIFSFLFLISYSVFSQPFTQADTLRGSNGPGRDWWDVLHYDITIKPDYLNKTIAGTTTIEFKVIKKAGKMQIDLQDSLVIDSINIQVSDENYKMSRIRKVNFQKTEGTYFIDSINYVISTTNWITIYYHGKPREAINPPWDGGMVWTKDKNNNPWISTACQDLGASAWYPCKDIQSDEPDDGAALRIIVPDSLVGIGNGRLTEKRSLGDSTTQYSWHVKSPINNYDIVPYIGKYVHFGEIYKGEKGDLDMDYWVLDYNLDKAKKQFKDATRMMKAFEYWFGPYPFYEDGYKLVDAPYLGMENQSAIAYGNEYKMGYFGHDRSESGQGLKWDFIIVHESGHEWFGNNITSKDIADMWIHEAFATYSEVLFTEYYYGKKAADDYCIGLRKIIRNDTAVIGPYGVNKTGSSDMYEKGANMIHTIRQAINNDTLFRKILRGLNHTFYHQTVTTKQIEDYISKESHINFSKVFDQYLRTTQIPVLEYKIKDHTLSYRWTNCVKGFNMPITVNFKGTWPIKPTEQWKTISMYPEGRVNFSIDRNFYIKTKKVE
ncbi:MAG TPA: M1 family metallopeptidase [Ferruginibacter sp.]|jgi:aminopeptidase N|nr:M1 family metallopeptidase [Ferruginibacter sp.]